MTRLEHSALSTERCSVVRTACPVRTARPSRRARWLKTTQRGFTLVELLVALTAGLLVSASAYLLARNSMKSYQDESRVASTQLSVSVGMARLQADLSRAGYMASPNLDADPQRCPQASTPAVTAVSYRNGTEGITGLLDADYGYGTGVNAPLQQPDMIVVTGNMTSTEQLEFRGCTSTQCYLAMDRGPMLRLLDDLGNDPTALRAVFVSLNPDGTVRSPRLARIVDQAGKHSYVTVTNVTVGGSPPDSVTLTISSSTNPGAECGFVDRGVGLINPVSIVRYRVGQIVDCNPQSLGGCTSPYVTALAATGPDSVTGESLRTDLLREELTPDAADTDKFDVSYTLGAGLASQEIVAEFAVELDIAARTDTSPAGAPGTASGFIDFNSATALDTFTDNTPQDVRSLIVRLGTRSRLPDRDATGPAGIVTRFQLPVVQAQNRFARMRTLQAEISLPNLKGVTW